jgi:hypothetical protein
MSLGLPLENDAVTACQDVDLWNRYASEYHAVLLSDGRFRSISAVRIPSLIMPGVRGPGILTGITGGLIWTRVSAPQFLLNHTMPESCEQHLSLPCLSNPATAI